MSKESEYWTRRNRIDPLLKKSGWETRDRSKVIVEVDTKQSDFRSGNYKTVSETLASKEEKAYADYLLLGTDGLPLAIIEAKRSSKNYVIGLKQAEGYADDIKKQTGKDVFIYLTNGIDIRFYNRPYEATRAVSGYHNRADLERIRFQNYSKKSFLDVPVNKSIIDRTYQIEALKKVTEGIERGERKFLIVQATGTGKTRVSMAIIDVLLRANRGEKVLFLADRKVLRDQAYDDGFKAFFPNESKSKIFTHNIDKSARLYVSTIQTMMECYDQFSPGYFDVIISDECHRSIYNKWKEVFTYFDAIEIGLTATPSELIDRDTFRFFNCQDGTPTHLYEYDEAVREKWLADYKVYTAQTFHQIMGIRAKDVPPEEKDRLLAEYGIEDEDINWEGTAIEKQVAVIGTNEALVREFMDNCLTDATGTLPAKTIIFAISKKHAQRIWEAFEKLYPEYKGRLTRVVTSDDSRATQIKDDFKKESFPRIAISVDMLDTGVDIPEVCNLVFAKPVFSKIKFWQMIGRGTRHNKICKHQDWLPNGEKEYFLIHDYWNNFEWFNMHPEGKEHSPSEAITTKIFLLRLKQLEHLQEENEHIIEVRNKIRDSIDLLPKDSVSIRQSIVDIETALAPDFWVTLGINPMEHLKRKIAPLMRYQQDVNLIESSWQLKIERLRLALLQHNQNEIQRLKDDMCEWLILLPSTINEVAEKEDLRKNILRESFWRDLSFADIEILEEFTSLMKFKQSEPRPQIIIDIDDIIQTREFIEYGPKPTQEFTKVYREKVEKFIKELARQHPTIQKIINDEVLDEQDIEELDKTLNGPDLYITDETLSKAFGQKGTLVLFIKYILGLYKFPDAKQRINEAFRAFIVERSYLNSNQINFIRTIHTVFSRKRHIEYSDLLNPPFTNFGIIAPVPLLSEDELNDIILLCNNLEAQLADVNT